MIAGKNKRLLIFFDEFQEVEKLKEVHFEELLRSKIQQQKHVNYLFFGSKTHIMQAMFNNKKRAPDFITFPRHYIANIGNQSVIE